MTKKRGKPRKTTPALTSGQLRGLPYERYWQDPQPRWALTPQMVAAKAGVTPRAVQKWRKDPTYIADALRRTLEAAEAERQRSIDATAAELTARLSRDDPEPPEPKPFNQRSYRANWLVILRRGRWPATSILDGKTYGSPEAWLDHLFVHFERTGERLYPAEDVADEANE